MDVRARIGYKAHIKLLELQRDCITRDLCWQSRMLSDVGKIVSVHTSDMPKKCEHSEIPYFVKRPTDKYIFAHQTGIVKARISGTPKPDVKWYKNWQRINDDNPRFKMHHYEPDIYVLEIPDTVTSDNALYTCVARNCYGCITSSATVRIIHLEIEEYPRFEKRLQSTDVTSGHNGRLEVRVSGVPKPKVEWFKNWIPLKENDHIEIRHYDPDSYVVNIYNAQPDDSGLYTCKARNDSGIINTSAMVHVKGNPNSFIYESYIPHPYHCIQDADWSEDMINIRRRLHRIEDDLGQMEKNDLLHKRSISKYYVKYRRPSYDYYDLF